jgi:EmrB/QacA subfamily drug resistance transporter
MHRPRLRRPGQPSLDSSTPSKRTLLILLCVAQLMVILDISAVNVALPALSKDLSIKPVDVSWTITAYSLVFGSLLLLGGRAADLLGRRRVFLAGLGIFTLSSLASAIAQSSTVLFGARAGQGLGAAMLSPAALSIIMTAFSEAGERTRALGAWGAIGGAGAAVGVLLGGSLTELVDWRAIFFINLPVGAVLGAATMRIIPRDPSRPRWQGLDVRGAGVATVSLASLIFAISQASSAGWISLQTLGAGGAGLAGLVAFAALELHTAKPLLTIQRLGDRAVGGGMLMMLAAASVLFGGFLLTSLYMQTVLGTGALLTGLAFLPMAVATGAGAHLGSQLIARFGVRTPVAAAFAVAASGLLLLSGTNAGGSYLADVLPGMTIAGLGLGVTLVGVAVSVLTGARQHETGMLSGLNTTGHEIGGSLGVAVLVSIATGGVGATATASVANGLDNAFLAAGIIAAVAGVLALIILPSARTFLPKLALAPPVPIH